jgi:hypothetical protein
MSTLTSKRPFSLRFAFWLREIKKNNSKLREGQALMLALEQTDYEVYDLIHGTEFDCFYDDAKVPAFEAEVFGTTNNQK